MMMMKFRFLDPVLARKYDSNGMATALFTMVGFEDAPRKVFVPDNIIEDLQKALLILMTFDCMEAFERREVLPKIVANASFFAEVMTKTETGDGGNDDIPNRSVNRFKKLRTCDDIRRMLEGFCKGDDLKIWIQTSSYSKLCRESNNSIKPVSAPVTRDNENEDPNTWQTVKKRNSKRSLLLSSSKPKSSSLKAITKAGNVKCRKPKIPKAMEAHLSEIQEKESRKRTMTFYSESTIPVSPISIPGFSYSSNFSILGIPPSCSSDNGKISSDSTVATVSSTSISSNSSADVLLEINNDGQDIETRRLLALAGCPGYGEFDGDGHGKDDFLSEILHSNNSFHATTTRNHLLPSFFENKNSLSSVSSSNFSANNAIFSSENSLSSESSSFESSSVASSMTTLSSYGCRRKKDANYFESSSLLQGSELEMANVLESVLDHALVPEYDTTFGDVIATSVEITKHSLNLPHYPCPTPKELLAMDWNH